MNMWRPNIVMPLKASYFEGIIDDAAKVLEKIGSRMLARIAKRTGLTPDDL